MNEPQRITIAEIADLERRKRLAAWTPEDEARRHAKSKEQQARDEAWEAKHPPAPESDEDEEEDEDA